MYTARERNDLFSCHGMSPIVQVCETDRRSIHKMTCEVEKYSSNETEDMQNHLS